MVCGIGTASEDETYIDGSDTDGPRPGSGSDQSHQSRDENQQQKRLALRFGQTYRRGGGLHDTADDDAIGEHVIIVLTPFARWGEKPTRV